MWQRCPIKLILMVALVLPSAARADTVTWAVGDGNVNVPTNWSPQRVPNDADLANLPYRGAGAYQVTVDVSNWHIDDLYVGSNATLYLGSNTVTCDKSAEIDGTLNIGGGNYYGTISLGANSTLRLAGGTAWNTVNPSASSHIYGYGTLDNALSGDVGEVQAQGGTLWIKLADNDHDDGTLSAATGATLKINDTANQENHATIRLAGGTLTNTATSVVQLQNTGTAGQTAVISGYGIIDNYCVQTGSYSRIDADGGSGRTLSLAEGFYGYTNYMPINVSGGTTLDVQQYDQVYWNQDGTMTMTGGKLTGEQMRQRGTLYIKGAGQTNSIQNAIFYGHVGTTTVSEGATLEITGAVYFDSTAGSTPIAESGAGGYLKVNGSGAFFSGCGTVQPDVTVAQGSLISNYASRTLALTGTLTVSASQSALANANNAVLSVAGTTSNSGNLYGTSGGDVVLAASLTNNSGGKFYATGDGSTATVNGGTVTNSGLIYALDAGLTDINVNVTNNANGKMYASGTSSQVNLDGFSVDNYGEIYAQSSGTVDVNAELTNRSSGWVYGSGSGANVYLDGLVSNSGAIAAMGGGSVSVSASLTNSSGSVYATGSGSTLLVTSGTVTNSGNVYAESGGTASIGVGVANNTGGNIYASNAQLTLGGATADNYGNIYAQASGSLSVTAALTNRNGAAAYATGSGSSLSLSGPVANDGAISVMSGGHVAIANDLNNRNTVQANGGSMDISGTVKASMDNVGDFAANSGTITFSGSIESGGHNTYTANSGGTIVLPGSVNTANFEDQALRPRGGKISLGAAQTLTNAATRTIKGHGQLLDDGLGQSLANLGTIEADGGNLTVRGNITNSGVMKADGASDSMTIGSTLEIAAGGHVAALNGASITIASPLVNDGTVIASGSGSSIRIIETSPSGLGTFIADSGGLILLTDGFTNKKLTNDHALQLAGGTIGVIAGTMANAAGKTISGFGTAVSHTGNGTLKNSGTVAAAGGTLTLNGNVNNSGKILAVGSGQRIVVSGLLQNSGIVSGDSGATIELGIVTNNGTIEVRNGGGTGRISFEAASGDGLYIIDDGIMTFASLSMGVGARLDDNGTSARIRIYGNLSKHAGAADQFRAEHSSVVVAAKGAGAPHEITWQAEDRGATPAGLIDNLALGHLTLDSGLGIPEEFIFAPGSTLYTYGLHFKMHTNIDLGGGIIYYLRAGDIVNGIVGQGFINEGNWFNGGVLDIAWNQPPVAEPASTALVLLGIGALARRRRS